MAGRTRFCVCIYGDVFTWVADTPAHITSHHIIASHPEEEWLSKTLLSPHCANSATHWCADPGPEVMWKQMSPTALSAEVYGARKDVGSSLQTTDTEACRMVILLFRPEVPS